MFQAAVEARLGTSLPGHCSRTSPSTCSKEKRVINSPVMKGKSLAFMLALAVGLPAFIVYNIFFQSPAPQFGPIKGFDQYKQAIEGINSPDYQVLGVIDEGALVRVNILSASPSNDPLETRIQTTNALYDVQSRIGREISVAVWNYRSAEAEPSSLLGMAFYHALAEQLTYKTPDDFK